MPEDEDSGGILNRLRSRYAFRIGLLVIIVAVVLGGLGFFTFNTVQASVQSDAEDALASAAEREAVGIDDFVDARNNDTLRLSSNADLTSMSESEVEEEFSDELAQLPESVVAIHLYNHDNGIVEVSTDDSMEGPVTTQSGDTQPPWVTAENRLAGPSSVLSFDPYESGDQKLLGFTSFVDDGVENHQVVVIVDLESRSELLTTPIEDSGIEVISHSTDQVVLGQDLDSIFREPGYLGQIGYLQDGSYSEPRVTTVNADSALVDDSSLVVASAPLDNKRWSVVVVASQSSAFSAVSDVTRGLALLIGVSLLGLLVVGAVITRDINKALSKTTEFASEIEQGNLNAEIEQSRQDEFGRLSGQFARLSDALQDQIRGSEQARKEAEVARAEAEELANYLRDKAEEYSEVMQEVGAGNLTERMEKDGEEESMDRIAEEFNDMIEELEKTTGQLKSYVDEVEESGNEVEQSATTVRQASEQVADSVQMISDDAYQQKERLESISQAMDEVADELESTATEQGISMDRPLSQIRDTSTDLNEVAELSEEMMSESEDVAGAAEEQAAELNTVSERAHDLQQYAQPLRDILERFETEKEHEFVFSVGPTGGARSPEAGMDDQPEGDEAKED